jgi:DNA replication protein DnaC
MQTIGSVAGSVIPQRAGAVDVVADEAPALHAKDGSPLWRLPGADDPGACSVCWGKGGLRLATGTYILCPECLRRSASKRIARLNAVSSWSQTAVGQTFENFSAYDQATKLARGAVRSWLLPTGRRWLYLHGAPGCGKSHLAAAAANHLTNAEGIPTLFITAPELYRWLREAFDKGANDFGERMDYSSRLEIVQSAPVLILDDLGAEKGSEWTDEVLWLILDRRYREQAPTLICSNLAPGQMRDARMTSRLNDRALVVVMQAAAVDYRRKGMSERAALAQYAEV